MIIAGIFIVVLARRRVLTTALIPNPTASATLPCLDLRMSEWDRKFFGELNLRRRGMTAKTLRPRHRIRRGGLQNAEMASVCQRYWRDGRKCWGVDHPHILAGMNNLSLV